MKEVIERYKRYYVPGEHKHKTLEDAMLAAWRGCEYNTHYTYEIIDGDTVYDRENIEKYWDEQGWNNNDN
jgi:hypothetical protein